MGAKKKSYRSISFQPYTEEEKILAQVAALNAGIVPIEPETLKTGPTGVARTSRRKFRKLWRKAGTSRGQRSIDFGFANTEPKASFRRRRRALVGALMNSEGKKLTIQ